MLANKIEQTNQPTQEKAKAFRFDVFKGAVDANGKVHKLKSVGNGHLVEGCKTYTIYLKTFLEDVFYLLPEQKKMTKADYVILTREPSQNPAANTFGTTSAMARSLPGRTRVCCN